ncbi:type VI secretion system tip protein VgrG [Vibrio sp.]|nr:type VI secretion system tip protein VgrG [Vibrio sp.]
MTELLSASSSTLSAKDYKDKEHLISQLSIEESLSEPYTINARLVSSTFVINQQLGQEIGFNCYDNNNGNLSLARSYHGIITSIQQVEMESSLQYASYELTVAPWLWLLKHTHAFRVYQEKTTKDIVTDIFNNAGFSGKFTINGAPSTKREYCLQYNESDFDFITRLLSEEGLVYFFEQSSSGHKLIIQDAQSPFDKAKINKFDMTEARTGKNPMIMQWMPASHFHGASIELTAYDYSQTKLVTSKAKTSSHSIGNNSKLKQIHYPPLGVSGAKTDLASNLVKRRIEQIEQEYNIVTAHAEHDEFYLGQYFSLSAHLDKSMLGDYSVTYHTATYNDEGLCESEIRCIPKSTPYYPVPADKVKVHGLQSATVAGSTAGEINQDAEGRVRIQFHWDTESQGDKTSCYVRVAQMLAGSGYGSQFIPRVGQEVLVSFIDGDPDQPVITGSVYNSKHVPPYKTANTTKSGFKTKLKGEANEWYFDDKKDNELIYLHAAKDLTTEVNNDMTTKVTNNVTETVEGEYKNTTTKAMSVTAKDKYTLAVTDALSETAKTISLEADSEIELKVGSSSITMSSSKIEIKASNIDIKASSTLNLQGTNVNSKATSANKVTGATTTLQASGSNTIKGTSIAMKASTTLKAEGSLSAEFKSGLKGTFNGGLMGEIKGTIVKVN